MRVKVIRDNSFRLYKCCSIFKKLLLLDWSWVLRLLLELRILHCINNPSHRCDRQDLQAAHTTDPMSAPKNRCPRGTERGTEGSHRTAEGGSPEEAV